MARLFTAANSEYLEIDSPPVTDFPFTFACWFKATTSTANMQLMAIADKDAPNYWNRLFTTTGNQIRAQTRAGGPNQHATTSNTFSDGAWHHALGVWPDADSRTAVLDGNYGSSATNSITMSIANMDRISLGRLGDSSPAAYYNGAMAEVAVWNVALSQTQGETLSKGFSPLLVKPESLVLYMPMNRPSGNEVDYINLLTLTDYNTVTDTDHPRIYNPKNASIGVSNVHYSKLAGPPERLAGVGGGLAL